MARSTAQRSYATGRHHRGHNPVLGGHQARELAPINTTPRLYARPFGATVRTAGAFPSGEMTSLFHVASLAFGQLFETCSLKANKSRENSGYNWCRD